MFGNIFCHRAWWIRIGTVKKYCLFFSSICNLKESCPRIRKYSVLNCVIFSYCALLDASAVYIYIIKHFEWQNFDRNCSYSILKTKTFSFGIRPQIRIYPILRYRKERCFIHVCGQKTNMKPPLKNIFFPVFHPSFIIIIITTTHKHMNLCSTIACTVPYLKTSVTDPGYLSRIPHTS